MPNTPTAPAKRVTIAWANPATAYAAAVRAGDTTNTVRWTNTDTGEACYSVLLPYDALGLAKDLVRNFGAAGVTLELASGRTLDEDGISAARY